MKRFAKVVLLMMALVVGSAGGLSVDWGLGPLEPSSEGQMEDGIHWTRQDQQVELRATAGPVTWRVTFTVPFAGEDESKEASALAKSKKDEAARSDDGR